MKVATSTIWLAFALSIVALGADGRGDPLHPIDSISGTTLRIIEAATPKFKERGLNLDQYLVSVFELPASFVVLFDDPKRSAGQRGSTPERIAFEVEVSKKDLAVLRANYVR